MLYGFFKYQIKQRVPSMIVCNQSKNTAKIIFNKRAYGTKNIRFVYTSMGYRRAYFRTLLIYVNLVLTNCFRHPDRNIFYYPLFITNFHGGEHPSFYFKRIAVR